MAQIQFAIEAPQTIVQELTYGPSEGVRLSAPVPVVSAADALDSPLGGQEIKEIFQILTVIAQTGAAALVFLDRLLEILRKNKATAVVKDPVSGKVRGHLRHDSERADAMKILGL